MKESGFVAVTSYFTLGEAIGSAINDGEEGKVERSAAETLLEFLIEQIKDGSLKLVTAEGVNNKVDELRTNFFDENDIADVHHVATAIKYGCIAFATSDRDLYGIDSEMKKEIKRIFHLEFKHRPPED